MANTETKPLMSEQTKLEELEGRINFLEKNQKSFQTAKNMELDILKGRLAFLEERQQSLQSISTMLGLNIGIFWANLLLSNSTSKGVQIFMQTIMILFGCAFVVSAFRFIKTSKKESEVLSMIEERNFSSAEFGTIRTLTVTEYAQDYLQTDFVGHFKEPREIMISKKLWFAREDIAAALGYEKPEFAVIKYMRGIEATPFFEIPLEYIEEKTLFIDESDVQRFVQSSKLPTAKKFEQWITEEVIPLVYGYELHHSYSVNQKACSAEKSKKQKRKRGHKNEKE